MRIDVRLFPLNVRSSSGTDIPEEVFNDYLNSDRCKDSLARKIMTGGFTHFTRSMPDSMENKIGLDDVQLLDGNCTHYIEKLWVNKTDGYVYCTAVIFDPDLFEGDMKKNIQNLIGFLKSGVMLGVSVVVDSLTDKLTGKATELLSIIGFDFTYNPAFKNTNIVKIYE